MDLAAAAAHHRQRVRNTYFQKNSKNDGRPSHPLALIELDFVRNAQARTKKCSPTKHVFGNDVEAFVRCYAACC